MDPLKWRLRYASSDNDETTSTTPKISQLNEQQKLYVNTSQQTFDNIRHAWANGTQLPEVSPSTRSINTQTQQWSSKIQHNNSNRSQQQQLNNNTTTSRRPQQSNLTSYSDISSDSDSDIDNINVNRVIDCLRTNEPFDHSIKLSSMVDILTVIWEDELE